MYGLGTFRKNRFNLFCLQIALIPEKIGVHIVCMKTKSCSFWHSFFSALELQIHQDFVDLVLK